MSTVSAPRGPRGGAARNERRGGGGRGGISKRSAGATRVDKDGDLMMMAGVTGGRGRIGKTRTERPPSSKPTASTSTNGASARRPARAGMQKAQQAILKGIGAKQANVRNFGPTQLKIYGLKDSKASANPDGGLEALLSFLERKAGGLDAKSNNTNRAVKINKSSMKGDCILITASPEDIERISKLDKFTFAGAVLTILLVARPSSPAGKEKPVSAEAQEIKEKLKAILHARYDSSLKLLNLSALAADNGLKEMGVFDGSTDTKKVFPALMAVCNGLFASRKEKKEAIISVTLTDNNLTSVSDVSDLADTFPDLENLDLSRNNLEGIKSLNRWSRSFRSLENLVLAGNPVEGELSVLHDELLKRYPMLHLLNNIRVRPYEEVLAIKAAAEAARSPLPVQAADFRDIDQVAENFIRQWVHLHDNDRVACLATFYDSLSTYSLSVINDSPRTGDEPVRSWEKYIKHSRNFQKISHLSTRMRRLHKGSDIQKLWFELPATRHPDLSTNPEKWMIECKPVSGLTDISGQSIAGVNGLIVTMHGEFEEDAGLPDVKSLRSFSRTFILGPAAPGSPNAIRVVSDMLALRAHSPLAEVPVLPAPAPVQSFDNIGHHEKEAIAMQLMEKTGMTLQYAGLCLEQSGWNIEKAFAMYDESKANLPADAWTSGVPM